MARREEVVVVPEFPGTPNRDRGKLFHIVEWDAERAEAWLIKATIAYNREAGEVPLDLADRGLSPEHIMILGINTFLRGNVRSEDVIPIMNELLDCVRIVRDPKSHRDRSTGEVVSHKIIDGDVEEVATRLWLRSEVLRIHTGFSVSAALSALISRIKKMPEPTSSPTPT